MSSRWSLYVVPDHWTLKDCMTIGYMYDCQLLMGDKEFKRFLYRDRMKWNELYDEIVKQPAIHNYTSDDGDPDHKKVMNALPCRGRLYVFTPAAYKLVPKLKAFAKEHEGKRYLCLN